MQSEGFMADREYSYAPIPHALAADLSVSANACRLWAVVHYLKWNRLEIEPADLAEAMGITGERSIYRWLAELEKGQWITWSRHNSNPQRRIVLRYGKQSPEAITLGQIRDLFSAGTPPTVEAIRELIDAPAADESAELAAEDEPEDEGGTGGNRHDPESGELLRRTDPVGRSAAGGTCDPVGTSANRISSANRITCTDPVGSESANRITWHEDSSLPEASNLISRDVGVGGTHGNSAELPTEPPTPRKPGRPPAHHPARPKTALENWLLDQQMLPASARRFAHLDLAAAQAAFREFMRDCPTEDRIRRIGSLVELWKERPPQPPQPPAARLTLDMEAARQLAQRLAPEADRANLNILAGHLADGMPEAEALDNLRDRQLFDQHWTKPASQAVRP
jgi:hypothetical protein